MLREERLLKDGVAGDAYLLFYGQRNKHGWMSNFSAHSIWLPHPFTGRLTRYRTTEHRYQAMKATSAEDHDFVNAAERPSETKDRGRQINLKDCWGGNHGDLCWYIMLECVLNKALQHAVILKALKETGTLHLYEDSPVDDIWGWRYSEDHRGKNLLGRAWMETRDMLLPDR